MNQQRFENLIKNHLSSNISNEEEHELCELMTKELDPDKEKLFVKYYDEYKVPVVFSYENKKHIWDKISVQINKPRIIWNRFIQVAASLFFIVSLSGLLFWYLNSKDLISPQQSSISLKSTKSTLYQKDALYGNTIPLSELDLSRYGIYFDSDGVIHFSNSEYKALLSDNQDIMVKSAAAKVQKIVLSDGSIVWLNTNSTLTLPAVFRGLQRIVHLEGEGYFEVSKSKMRSFIVKSGSLITEVVGTKFIVNNTRSEETVTLLEGKVNVSNSNSSFRLTPGNQAFVHEDELVKVNVDTLDLAAWKDGYFKFDNLSTTAIMDQIKDWYDVKFVINNLDKEEYFSGTYKRTDRLEDLLKSLEEVSSLKFRIQEGGVYVLNK